MTLAAQKTRCPHCGSEPDDGTLLALAQKLRPSEEQIAAARNHLIMESLDDEPGCLGAGVGRTQPEPAALLTASDASKPIAWICTDFDGHAGIGFTQEAAQEGAPAGCDQFLGLVDGPAVATYLLRMADQLDAELTSGAKWSSAQHACCDVSTALRDMARAASVV